MKKLILFLILTFPVLASQSQSSTARSTDSLIVRCLTDFEARTIAAILLECEKTEKVLLEREKQIENFQEIILNLENNAIDKQKIIGQCETALKEIKAIALDENMQKLECWQRLEQAQQRNRRRGWTIAGLSAGHLLWLLLIL